MIKMKSMLIVFVILIPLTVGVGLAFSAANQAGCEALKGYVEGLTDETFGMPVTNVTADWKQVGTSETYFCQVTGWMWPEIKFQVTLPTISPAWNERYVMNGGGGWDGSLSVPNAPDASGYAQSSANGGYMGANWPNDPGTFGLKEPYFSTYYNAANYPTGAGGYYGSVDPIGSGNPYACQKVVDFGTRHLMETPIIAKKIVKQYYGKDPQFSYYSGRSCGGKEGQISAQKYSDLYDGFYIGCALGGHVAVTFRGTWDTLWGKESHLSDFVNPICTNWLFCPTVHSVFKAQAHRDSVYQKCDGVDGLVDGLIDDPRKCKFDALTDLPACADENDIYSTTCFTLAQRQALKEIYAGPHDSKGNAWYPGQPLGAEYIGPTMIGFVGSGFAYALNDGWAAGMFANIALDPPMGPGFDINTFDWNTDPIRMQETTCQQCYGDGTCDTFNIHNTLDGITISPTPAPNMGGFEPVYKKGAKIVQEHGWADSLVSALPASVGLYETVMNTMGADKTKSFWKLYMVPGQTHCSGGIGINPTTQFQALVDWVENGIDPGALMGTRTANTDPYWPNARTRPICPYPEVARWNGSYESGGIDNASNFMCVPPIEVRIEPETLNLKSKGEFTAFITVPKGYDIRDWNIANLSCEGALAVKGVISGNKYIVKFKRQDLKGVQTGDEVTLTVKGTFTYDGQTAQIQASDTIRVIK